MSKIHVHHGQALDAINSLEGEYYDFRIQGEESIAAFKEMVRRALNCWPDAAPELKELGDMLMHGRVLQDYYYTRTDKKSNTTQRTC